MLVFLYMIIIFKRLVAHPFPKIPGGCGRGLESPGEQVSVAHNEIVYYHGSIHVFLYNEMTLL